MTNSKVFVIVSGILLAIVAFIMVLRDLLPAFLAVPVVILYILFIVHIDR